MPYFKWRGVNILGSVKKGRSFARTHDELQELLLKRDIALLSVTASREPLIQLPIGLPIKIQFFRQLISLLESGILLPEALHIIANQIDHSRFQELIHIVADAVRSGVPFHQSLAMHPATFTPLMIHIAHIGQETGRLAQACQALCIHLTMIDQFKRSVRAVLIMPAITCGFFLLIATVILVWVVPHFVTIFSSMHQQLPYATQLLIRMSMGIHSHILFVISALSICLILMLRSLYASSYGKRMLDSLALHMPLIGRVMHDGTRAHLLRSLSTLIKAGISVPTALHISSGAVANTILRDYVSYLEHAVTTGSSLSQAMSQHPEQWFDQQIVAFVIVGEESGTLADALGRGADQYEHHVERYLTWCATFLQPMLVVILGLLIALFIFAVYMPIFNLAHVAY